MAQEIYGSSKSQTVGIRFKNEVLEKLDKYADKYFNGNRTAACNNLLKNIFRSGSLLLYTLKE